MRPEDPPPADSLFGPPGADETVAAGGETWIQPLLTAVLLLFAWVAFFELSAYERRHTLETTASRNANLALALEQYTVRVLRNADAVTQFVATAYERGARGAQLRQVLQERAAGNDAFVEVLFLEGDGMLMESSTERSALPPGRLAVPAGAAPLGLVVAPPFAAPGGGRLVPLLRPVGAPGSAVQAWAAVLVDSRRFVALLEQAQIPDDMLVVLALDSGAVLAAWSSRGVAPRLGPVDSARLPPQVGQGSQEGYAGLDGQARLLSVRQYTDYPVRTLVASSSEDALQEFRQRRQGYLWACIAATLFGLSTNLALLGIQRRRMRTAARLARARQRLAEMNAGLELQVSERTRQLQQINRELESFSWSVAHDLRAPLSAIQGFSEQLEPAIAAHGDPRLAHYLRRIRANAAQMGRITEGLLQLARISRSQVERIPVDLTALAQEVVESLREADPQRPVQVGIEQGLVATGDSALLRQVLENLLGNAWKFTGRTAEPRIVVGSSPARQGETAFHVRDNGAGFDMAHASNLFHPFRRLHTAEEFSGTGVGLALVERIVQRHGGRLWAEAQPGQGATFHVALPT